MLGPFLFCIFINDLPLHIQAKKVRNSLFADDSSLNTSGKTLKEIEVRLQKVSPRSLTGVKRIVCVYIR